MWLRLLHLEPVPAVCLAGSFCPTDGKEHKHNPGRQKEGAFASRQGGRNLSREVSKKISRFHPSFSLCFASRALRLRRTTSSCLTRCRPLAEPVRLRSMPTASLSCLRPTTRTTSSSSRVTFSLFGEYSLLCGGARCRPPRLGAASCCDIFQLCHCWVFRLAAWQSAAAGVLSSPFQQKGEKTSDIRLEPHALCCLARLRWQPTGPVSSENLSHLTPTTLHFLLNPAKA